MGNIIFTKRSANQYWMNLQYNDNVSVLPTVTTDSLVMHFSLNATVDGTVVSEGSSSVISYGFVWSETNPPTLSDHVIVVGSGPFTGGYTSSPGGLPLFTTVYFAAYATNGVGTSYGAVLSGETQICFAEGTLMSMGDGSKKKIEDIGYSDELLVWNFDEGVFDKARPVWIVRPFKANYYGLLKFSDGSELRTVADGRGHRIFNVKKGMFTYSMSEDTPSGAITTTDGNKFAELVSKEIIRKDTMFYNVITHTHFNTYANGILASTGLNNLYPIVNMKFIKYDRKIRNDFKVSKELFEGLRLGEQEGDIQDKLKMMVERQV